MKYNLLEIVKSEINNFDSLKQKKLLYKEVFLYENNVEIFILFDKCKLSVKIDEYEQANLNFYMTNLDKSYSLDNVLLFNLEGYLNYIYSNKEKNFEPFDKIDLIKCFNKPLSEDRFRESLRNELKKVSNFLMHVIEGDFSWIKKHDIFYENCKLISSKLGTVFIENHESFKKMIKGDQDWKNELER